MKDYFGADGYLTGLGFRKKGPRPVTNEFSKSLLLDELTEEEEELKRKKRRITELQDIDVSEISYVDRPATKKKFMIVKGDDKEMNEEKELKGWEDVSEKELSVIKETISILNKYDLVDDLKRAKETLTKYFGEEVKKYNERCEWTTVQNQLYGYTEDDLAMVSESDIYEIEKSYNEDDKWPSLSGQFNRNKKVLERIYEERELEGRLV